MEVTRILAEIDAQVARLQQARALLADTHSSHTARKSVGRPRKHADAMPVKKTPAKRTLSPEARKRIADAQKRRWAESRAAAE